MKYNNILLINPKVKIVLNRPTLLVFTTDSLEIQKVKIVIQQ